MNTHGRSELLIATLTARKALRSGVVWGYIFGIAVASSALGYVSTYKTTAARAAFAATFGSNAGLDAITGPANQLQTVAGYTAWKALAFLSVLGGVWGVLTATRLMRGEEDAGRWELLLVGQTTRRRATAQALCGLGVGGAAVFGLTAIIGAAVGDIPKVHIGIASMLFFAVAIVSSAAIFLAAGALTSQLAATRRQAAGYAGVTLGVAYALRMVADSGSGLEWLRWATPLGWVEELRPLTAPRPLALLPIVGLTVILVAAAIHLAGRRDLGDSVLPDRSSANPHVGLLFSPLGLTIRLGRATVVAWMVAVAASGLLLGLVAKQAGTSFSETPSIANALHKLGLHGAGATSYLGVSLLLVAVLVAFVSIGQMSAVRDEEGEGRLDHLLVRPTNRSRWLSERVAVAGTVVIGIGLIGSTAAWVGAAIEHSDVGIAGMAGAGVNLAPPALFLLGIGVLTFGWWPRATSVVLYGALAWSFLDELIGGIMSANHWFLDASLFHQMAAAPAVTPNWTANAVMVGLALAACSIGTIGFRRRDLVTA